MCFMWLLCSADVGLLFGPCAAYAAGSGWQTPWPADGMGRWKRCGLLLKCRSAVLGRAGLAKLQRSGLFIIDRAGLAKPVTPYPHIALKPHTPNPGHHSHVYPLSSNKTWTSVAILARAKIVQAIRASEMSSSHDHHAGATPPRPSLTLWRRRLVSQQDSPAGELAPRESIVLRVWGQRASQRPR